MTTSVIQGHTAYNVRMWNTNCKLCRRKRSWPNLNPNPVLQEPGLPGWGGLKNRGNKLCSRVQWDSDLRKDALAMPGKNWKVQTRPLVREGAPRQETRNCKKNLRMGKRSRVPGGCLIPRRTGRQTVRRNVTLTLTLLESLTKITDLSG
jgi:hypothetical protein